MTYPVPALVPVVGPIIGPLQDLAPGSLKPFPNNPRRHPPKQLASLKASITAYGFTVPIIIDELDTSLHTLLVRELVRLFHRPETNTGGAQLIFTTHDTSLLDAPGLFRRDQIWFVEKERDQASVLVSLSEFSPRKNEALERGYLMGRYGAVPFLERTLGLKH